MENQNRMTASIVTATGNEAVAARVRSRRSSKYIALVGTGRRVEEPGGTAWALRGLGADVRTIGLRDHPRELVEDDDVELDIGPRAIVFDPYDRLDLAAQMLRDLRALSTFRHAAALLVVPLGCVTRLEPAAGFDDFIVPPCSDGELYARIRALEWRRSEFAMEERYKVGRLVVDPQRSEVAVDGRPVSLTAKEFALLAYLCEQRGRVLSRDHLLARVWGREYDGGKRTVDIHVRRLRSKLGDALPLETLRRWGYRLREP